MNYGALLTWVLVALNFGAAIGYLAAHDHQKAAYFFFAACITATFVVDF